METSQWICFRLQYNMQRFSEEEEDVFFDMHSTLGTGTTTPDSPTDEDQGLQFRLLESEFWSKDLKSVHERRNRFLHGMGFDEFVSTTEAKKLTLDRPAENMGAERVTENSGAALDTLSPPDDDENHNDNVCCIRDLDSGKKIVIHDLGQDGLFSMLREVGSNKLTSLQEFEERLDLSCSVQKMMRKEAARSAEKRDTGSEGRKNKLKNWWRRFMAKRPFAGTCKNEVSVKDSIPRMTRAKVLRHKKRCLEFTAVYMGQEIRAHKGLIRTMKFNSLGCYIASGGEDRIVRIWKVREAEASCKCNTADRSCEFVDKANEKKLILGRKNIVSAPIVIPKKVFKIDENPLQELHGHSSDVLDLSWSNSDYLLTSSMDKTVRMWKVGCEGCLQVFQHNDYVTCVQFNPVDHNYFISGSIDGKVRIWGVCETHVVDWADVRDIVTAICYRPDGEGFVVGSLAGNCRTYNYSGNVMQLDTQFCVQGSRKKSASKLITGLQFSPEDSSRVMVTSADSKVRIFDGAYVVRKFRGLRRSKSQLSASFTSDGRYIVSIGADSNVYIWNYEGSPSSGRKSVKSIRSCEHFFSEGVSIAVPWTGRNHRESGLSKDRLHLPCQPVKILEPSTWLWDSDLCSLGAWLFADGLSTGSATWPEEKLPFSPQHLSRSGDQYQKHRDHQYHMHAQYHKLTCLSASWSLVIVTASRDGTIRTFHNYGLPVRL